LLIQYQRLDRRDITEILLKVALNTIKQTSKIGCMLYLSHCLTCLYDTSLCDKILKIPSFTGLLNQRSVWTSVITYCMASIIAHHLYTILSFKDGHQNLWFAEALSSSFSEYEQLDQNETNMVKSMVSDSFLNCVQ